MKKMNQWGKKTLALALTTGMIFSLPYLGASAAEKEISFDLEQIVVTATKTEKKVKDVPASVSVVTAEEIEKSGANNLADVLKKVNGLFVVDLYGNGNDTRIGLRGFQGVNANQNVQVQVDGISVNDQGQNIATALGNINVASVERIEVIKGPASALYGANSIGGVVNIITKKGEGKGKTTVTAKGGSFSGKDYLLTNSGADNNLAYQFSYRKQDGDGYRKNSDYDDKLLHSRLDFNLSDKSSLELLLDHSDRHFRMPGTLTQAQYDLDPRIASTPDDYRNVKENRFAAIHKSQITNDATLTNKFFYSKIDQQIRMDFDVPPKNDWIYHLPKSEGKTFGVESQINLKKQISGVNHEFITGVLYKKEELSKDYFNVIGGVQGSLKSNTLDRTTKALFLQDEIECSSRITMSAGLRYDKFDFDYEDHKNSNKNYKSSTNSFSPKIALNYKVSEKTNAYCSIAKAFKPPSDPKLLYTNNLEPEEAWNYEVGVKSSPNARLNYSLALYRMNIDNLVVLDPIDLVSSRNAGKAHHQGVELESEYLINQRVSAILNYSYMQAKYDKYSYEDDYGNLQIADKKNIEEVPKQMFITGLRYDDQRGLQANLDLRWVDKQYMDAMNKASLPSYSVVDMGLRKKIKDNVTASLNIFNLFDKKYAENAHYNTDVKEYGYLPANGRTTWAGISVEF